MTETEYLLTVTEEEAAELIQRLSKAARFGMDQVQSDGESVGDEIRTDVSANPEHLTNRERIIREYSHLVASLDMLGIHMVDIDPQEVLRKQRKVKHYLWLSRDLGIVT